MDEKKSTEIVISHVIKGIEIAKKHKLPKEIINFISTHHGTSRTEFFYRNYIKSHPDEDISEEDFRYPGPKPLSKEMAVLMIVDSVEAASKSLKDPTAEELNDLIEKIVEFKLKDGQFEKANITIKEINTTKDVLKEYLSSIYHNRIKYPDEENQED